MMKQTELIIITDDGEAAQQLRHAVAEAQGEEPLVTERRGIDGAAAQWIILAVATIQSLGGIFGVLSQYAGRDKVTKIKCGEFEVENPRDQDVDRLLEICTRHMSRE
ncbi:hypothetical protein [Streptomyces sp. NPDC053542]|uniref:hypothetical protein n=1 Tax=Streptomyces sp. NPDC053542 TaxID=3365710 RepID=UPI0037D47D9D